MLIGERECTCDRIRVGPDGLVERFDAARDCAACYQFAVIPAVNQEWGGTGARRVRGAPAPAALLGTCPLLGDVLRRCVKGDCSRHVRRCVHPDNTSGETTTGKNKGDGGLWSCQGCDARPTDASPLLKRTAIAAGSEGEHFNGSILEYAGRLMLADRRTGRLYLSELDPTTYRRLWTRKLEFPALPGSNQEDPRLFVLGGRLHVWFAVARPPVHNPNVRQAYAEIRDDWTAGEPCEVRFARGQQEKNWGPFEHRGELLAVYTVAPSHVILRIDGPHAEVVANTPNPRDWLGGHARGGAPPVRVGSEYVGWFHGALDAGVKRTYSVGLYRFDAIRPFRVASMSPAPLLWARPTEAHPDRRAAHVVFPAGAVLRGDRWLVSAGVADRRTEVLEFPATIPTC